jgi:Xaa-Pro aminopeptidase
VVTKAAKCSIVTTYCGHGIGELFHTSPNVPHYPKNKAKGTMQPGHIFTIEPMINLGKGWLPCELCYCVSILVVGLNTLAVIVVCRSGTWQAYKSVMCGTVCVYCYIRVI